MSEMDYDGGGYINPQPVASLKPAPTPKINVEVAKSALKIPNWVWVIIAIVSIAIITVAILIPLVFIKSTTHTSPTSVSPTSSQHPFVPTFSTVAQAAILFQLAIPPLDGFSKGAINITQTDFTNNITKVGFTLVGSSSKTGYYVTAFNPPVITAPVVLNTLGSITTWGSSDGTNIIISNPTFFSCLSNVLTDSAPCQVISWPNLSNIDNTTYTVTSWKKASDTVMISFVKNDLSLYELTVQTEATVLALSQVFLGLQDPLNVSIVCMFSTYNQDYLSFGVVQKFTNTVMYVTYNDIFVATATQSIILDPLVETLEYASMTNDGLWLIVLSSQRLILYNRSAVTISNIDFAVADSVYLKTSIQPLVCAIDQTYDTSVIISSGKIWCAIGSQDTNTIVLPIDTVNRKFLPDLGRLIPGVNTNDTSGPMNIRFLPDSNSLFLLTSDEFGNYENTTLDMTKYA